MRGRLLFLALTLTACNSSDSPATDVETAAGFDLPVLTNAESPVGYPTDLYARRVEASVLLRIFVTAEGAVVPESTTIVEPSGYAAFDSAAMVGVESMQFAPAQQDGQPVSTMFLQPIHFRHPERAGPGEGL